MDAVDPNAARRRLRRSAASIGSIGSIGSMQSTLSAALPVVALALAHPAGAQEASRISFNVTAEGGGGDPMPCRIYCRAVGGEPVRPPGLPFWEGGFVCPGEVTFDLPAGRYRYEVERGPEWSAAGGEIEVGAEGAEVGATLRRVADLKAEGWFAGDLHVHRAPQEMKLHLPAEDLSVASVQTWWNRRNLWPGGKAPPEPVVTLPGGRRYHRVSGEDERGGGALLYHRLRAPIDITGAEREWPSSVAFLHQADAAGAWVEIEKPFWWDTPAWIATGVVDSIGIAQNHMNRRGVLENEAWGRPRDREVFPGVHGNGRYTQDLYYKILDCGLRIPPSAGSASGVLRNPVGYNRVYVLAAVPGEPLDWDRWWEALRAGRSFVTNGPLLRATANGQPPGAVFRAAEPGDLTVRLEVRLDSRDPLRALELVRDGGRVEKVELPVEFTVERSGWFLLRAIADVDETFRFASTAPWYVEVGGGPMEPHRPAASFFHHWAVERREKVRAAVADPTRRAEAVAPHDLAVRFWDDLVARARAGER